MRYRATSGRTLATLAILGPLALAGTATSEAGARTVPLQNATATYTQPGPIRPELWGPSNTIDGRVSGSFTSWATVNRDIDPGGDPNLSEAIVWETRTDLTLDGRLPLEFRLHFKDGVPIGNRGLGRFKISYTTDPRDRFADGLANGGDVVANWTTIDLVGLFSDSGETFETLEDGSVLVQPGTGTAPTYQATALLAVADITGFRLDALQHPSLPFGGPGAGGVGGDPIDLQNFHLSEFEVHAVPVPAALPLLATAMGGLGWMAHRRRRSATDSDSGSRPHA